MKTRVLSLMIAALVASAPVSAAAQDVPARVAVETVAGVGGALGLGFVGLAAGMTGSLLVGPGKIEPTPPIIGAAVGATLGLVGGVTLSGQALGGTGTPGGATGGFLAGAALTGAAWTVGYASKGRERGLARVLIVASVLLPIVGTVAGFEM